jgi:hypothetical protein
MSAIKTVCIGASNTLRYPQGGHLWVFINWALGFKANGCQIVWLDVIDPKDSIEVLQERVALLKSRLAPYGLANTVALVMPDGTPIEGEPAADLLFDLRYDFPESLVKKFRRSALLDIDPGLLQVAMQNKHMNPAPHDVYFTIGESVGQSGSRFPSLGLNWVHIPPCISLEHWPKTSAPKDAAFSTVSHWYMNEWMVDEKGETYKNDKRSAFMPYLELPGEISSPLELAIHLNNDPEEQKMLESHGWRIKEAHAVASTPSDFQNYVQNSLGEFGCAKPAYVKMQTSWISDRTLCYLASGHPAIIENTGPTKYFDGREGALRFSNFDEAIACFGEVEKNYAHHASAARGLAEKHFDAKKITAAVLERCES